MSKTIDENGFWLVEDNPVSIEGVFPYLGKTIDKRLEPDRIYQVYRPFKELSNPETLKSFDGIPFIDDHEMIGEGFTPVDKRPAAGVMMNPRAENGTLRADLKIFSEGLKDKIAGGKKELSLGYQCTYELRRGVWNGQPYDAIQRNVRGNHIALVDQGRMGADVRVYDRAITCDSLDITQAITSPANHQKENRPMAEENKNPKSNETPATDEAVDKRKLIDEIGGILKDKVDEEILRTILAKAEKLAYNASEAGKATDEDEEKKAEDECGKDGCGKDEDEDDKEKSKSMDAAEVKRIVDEAVKEALAAAAKKSATDSADKKPGKVYGMAEDSKPAAPRSGLSPFLAAHLNKNTK